MQKKASHVLLLSILLLMVFIVVGGVLAQDDEGDAEGSAEGAEIGENLTETSAEAPSIISIEPEEVTIEGVGAAMVTVTYDDVNQDAIRFAWSSETEGLVLPDGLFNQVVVGTEISVPFYCWGGAEFSAEIQLEVVDYSGLVSDPASFTLNCTLPEPPEPVEPPDPSEPAEPIGGTAPVIDAITPEQAFIDGPGDVFVTVAYSDPDTDARAFLWSMGDNNMLDFELPPGFFQQEFIGNEIPVRFICTRPDFFAEINLVVVDAEGNVSEPETFTLFCE